MNIYIYWEKKFPEKKVIYFSIENKIYWKK